MSHTPLPWRSTWNAEEDREGLHRLRGGNHHLIARGLTFEDAEFIVRAVNNHEALLEAAKSVLAAFDDSHYGGITDPHRSSALSALVRAVENAERG